MLVGHICKVLSGCMHWKSPLISSHLNCMDSSGWEFFFPILSRGPVVPECLVKLIQGACAKSKCAGRCTCKNEGYDCTVLCGCQGTKDGSLNVRNLGTVINSEDEEENED